jgi:hypothetical protein
MIRPEKLAASLYALNGLLVSARTMAYKKEDHARVAELLDTAEILPMLIRDKEDKTDFFRSMLVECSQCFPETMFALQRFDEKL